jgi:Trypsin
MRVYVPATTMSLLAFFALPAFAVVGPASDGAQWQKHVVMVLSRSGARAGFCTGVVLTRAIILTAAHCVSNASDTRAYLPGRPLLPVRQVAKHPDFHADAPRTRTRSIDLALIRLAEPLPSEFAAPPLADASPYPAGTAFNIAGFGVSHEGDEKTSGVLRIGSVKLRAPLSSVLLWLEDADGEIGGCTGDSGGPVLTTKGELAGIIAFAEGGGSRHCGALTQAMQIAPQRVWIESIMQRWE